MVAGTQRAVLMVESEARELAETVMLGAVVFGHEQMQAAINAINALADEVNPVLWDWAELVRNEALIAQIARHRRRRHQGRLRHPPKQAQPKLNEACGPGQGRADHRRHRHP